MVSVEVDKKKWYLSNYPFKVNSIKDNDEIYHSTDNRCQGKIYQ